MKNDPIKISDTAKLEILDVILPTLIRISAASDETKPALVKILAKEELRIYQIAKLFGEGYFGISKTIREHKIEISARNGKKLPDEKKKKIRELLLTTNLSHNAIKRIVGCSKCAVYWESKRIKREAIADDLESQNALSYSTLARPRRCPVHGLVNQWPCVACEAEAARSQKLGQ
jgi:hypothetical protein